MDHKQFNPLAQVAKDALIERFRYDIGAFGKFFWPDRFNAPYNEFHIEELEKSAKLPSYRQRGGGNIIDTAAAPRGIAKSSINSFLIPIHRIVYDLERYFVFLSANSRTAVAFVKDLRDALMGENKELEYFYGKFERSGKTYDTELYNTLQNTTFKISSFGMDSSFRGIKHKGVRPTYVILDDAEDKNHVKRVDQRDKIWSCFNSDIMKLLDTTANGFVKVVGTVLHADGLINKLLETPGVNARKWQAVIKWPEREDLWERCRQIWCNLSYGDRREDFARAFYEAHKEDMDRGSKILDPYRETIYTLYVKLWREGRDSFFKDLQNDIVGSSTSVFCTSQMARCTLSEDCTKLVTDEGREVAIFPTDGLPHLVRRLIALDPIPAKDLSLERTKKGDLASIAVLGMDSFGLIYVLEVWADRVADSKQLDMLWKYCEKYQPHTVVIETTSSQRMIGTAFGRQKNDRLKRGQFAKVDITFFDSRTAKQERIAAMEACVSNGWLVFSDKIPHGCFQQFEDFPYNANDDMIDAISMGFLKLECYKPPSMQRSTRIEF